PDLFVPAAGTLGAALEAIAAGGAVEPLFAALGEWALDAEAEPIERMRRDCLRFQNALTRGAALQCPAAGAAGVARGEEPGRGRRRADAADARVRGVHGDLPHHDRGP